MRISRDKVDICRARKKKSVADLAEAYGVSRARMNVILNQREVSVVSAGRLADALGVDVTEIIEDGKSVRMYFHCPYCGRRVRYLYNYYKHYSCRKCAKLNYASQQKSGMDEMRLKMERIVEKELGYT